MDMEARTTIADTGFVVALLNRSDRYHAAVVQIYAQQQTIILPQTVLAETAYLVGRASGIKTVIEFLRSISASCFQVAALTPQELSRVADILEQYADSRIDFVDATVMAVAEQWQITTVLTLDRRDFSLFRPQHCDAFTLLP